MLNVLNAQNCKVSMYFNIIVFYGVLQWHVIQFKPIPKLDLSVMTLGLTASINNYSINNYILINILFIYI